MHPDLLLALVYARTAEAVRHQRLHRHAMEARRARSPSRARRLAARSLHAAADRLLHEEQVQPHRA